MEKTLAETVALELHLTLQVSESLMLAAVVVETTAGTVTVVFRWVESVAGVLALLITEVRQVLEQQTRAVAVAVGLTADPLAQAAPVL
jgi:hypothetical protein